MAGQGVASPGSVARGLLLRAVETGLVLVGDAARLVSLASERSGDVVREEREVGDVDGDG
jgi:hypothetical protein